MSYGIDSNKQNRVLIALDRLYKNLFGRIKPSLDAEKCDWTCNLDKSQKIFSLSFVRIWREFADLIFANPKFENRHLSKDKIKKFYFSTIRQSLLIPYRSQNSFRIFAKKFF